MLLAYDAPRTSLMSTALRVRAERETAGAAGVNSFGKMGFGGPCPPQKDHAHHYHFHVYALDVDSLGRPGLSKEDALEAMQGHIVAEGELVATYQRKHA